jgi:hypothetical protein
VPDPATSPAISPPPVSATPRTLRQLCAVAAVVVLAATAVVVITLPSSSTGVVSFAVVDQVALAGLGVILAAAVLTLGRPRMDADATGVRIQNVIGTRTVPWSVVRAVRFERKSRWATLQLTNDDVVAVFAVQAIDGERAVQATNGLRALLAAHVAAQPARPPLLYDD